MQIGTFSAKMPSSGELILVLKDGKNPFKSLSLVSALSTISIAFEPNLYLRFLFRGQSDNLATLPHTCEQLIGPSRY